MGEIVLFRLDNFRELSGQGLQFVAELHLLQFWQIWQEALDVLTDLCDKLLEIALEALALKCRHFMVPQQVERHFWQCLGLQLFKGF